MISSILLRWVNVLSPVFLGVSFSLFMSGRATAGVFLLLGSLGVLFRPGSFKALWQVLSSLDASIKTVSLTFVMVWLAGTYFSISFSESIQVWVRMGVFLALAVAIYGYLQEDKIRLNLLLRASLISLLFVSLLALAGLLFSPDIIELLKAKQFDDMNRARVSLRGFGSLSIMLIFYSAWAGYFLGGKWVSVGGVACIPLLLIALLSESESGVAGLVAAFLIAFLCSSLAVSGKIRNSLVIIFAVAFLISAVGFYIFSGALEALPGDIQDKYAALNLYAPHWLIDPHRQIIWRHTFEFGLERPWLGWGINAINYADLPERLAMGGADSLTPYSSHPHNWILEVFSETGVLGLLPFSVGVFMLFWYPFRALLRTGNMAFMAMLAISAAFWASSLFNISFWSAWWQISYLLLMAILTSAAVPSKKTQ